jgi:hypothetical protein
VWHQYLEKSIQQVAMRPLLVIIQKQTHLIPGEILEINGCLFKKKICEIKVTWKN